ncbi:uncharacterized protein [Littorina saxatilis]|uniref:uncharacterized protein n=1 Tax=Littorina saxatilis TaxID=31220 RepID=UPI0038B69978
MILPLASTNFSRTSIPRSARRSLKKPKVFFVDACRGGDRPEAYFQPRSSAPPGRWITDKRDFLLSFASTRGNVSWSSKDSNACSLYIGHLCRLLQRDAERHTVEQILKTLSSDVNEGRPKVSLQTPQSESTLTKELYFHDPGSCLRVLLVGQTGAGKSSLGNTLTNLHDSQQGFIVSRRLGSETIFCEWRKTTWEGLTIEVTDTPGLRNSHLPEYMIHRELSRSIALCHPGPHVIIFTTRCDRRFTTEEFHAYNFIKEMFGAAMTKHLIVVFNGLDVFMDHKDVHGNISTYAHTNRQIHRPAKFKLSLFKRGFCCHTAFLKNSNPKQKQLSKNRQYKLE